MLLNTRATSLSQITQLTFLALLVISLVLLASVIASNAAQFVDMAGPDNSSEALQVSDINGVSADTRLGMLCYRECSLVR